MALAPLYIGTPVAASRQMALNAQTAKQLIEERGAFVRRRTETHFVLASLPDLRY